MALSLVELAREDLGAFALQAVDLWPAAHHDCWVELLANPGLDRLLIIAPPGHAKSTWCTTLFPAWLIGRNPRVNILLVSATAAQAHLFSAAVRETLQANPAYAAIFPGVTPDRKRGWAQGSWFVQRASGANKDATVAACGVGGPLIGRRADVIIVDDPCDDANTATPARREKLWRWFRQTLLTRLRPGGRVIVVMTRWHEDDLAARLLRTGEFLLCHMRARSEGEEVQVTLERPDADDAIHGGNPVDP